MHRKRRFTCSDLKTEGVSKNLITGVKDCALKSSDLTQISATADKLAGSNK